jgi:hypothetical protein
MQAWISTIAAVVSAAFAMVTWRLRRSDGLRQVNRNQLYNILSALQDVR